LFKEVKSALLLYIAYSVSVVLVETLYCDWTLLLTCCWVDCFLSWSHVNPGPSIAKRQSSQTSAVTNVSYTIC